MISIYSSVLLTNRQNGFGVMGFYWLSQKPPLTRSWKDLNKETLLLEDENNKQVPKTNEKCNITN